MNACEATEALSTQLQQLIADPAGILPPERVEVFDRYTRKLYNLGAAQALSDALAILDDPGECQRVASLLFRLLWKQQAWQQLVETADGLGDLAVLDPDMSRLLVASLRRLEWHEKTLAMIHQRPRARAPPASVEDRQGQIAVRWSDQAARAAKALAHDRLLMVRHAPWLAALSAEGQEKAADATRIREVAAAARRVLSELAVADRWQLPGPRHLAIAGLSYCGSTLLGAILGSLPGCENVGESHWLIDKKAAAKGQSPMIAADGTVHCATCGPDCRYWTAEFRAALQADPSLWYLKIAEHLDTQNLISSDKSLEKYRSLDPLLRMDTLVLFKSPAQHWWSNRKKLDSESPDFRPMASLSAFRQRWIKEYGFLADRVQPQGRKVLLCFDAFCLRPATHLRRLCELFDLPFESSMLAHLRRDQHFLGGNALVGGDYRQREKPLHVRALPDVDLSAPELRELADDTELQRAWERCMADYRRDFSDC